MSKPALFFRIWLPRVLALLLCLHLSRGLLPFTAVEGDDQGVVNGLQAWIRGTGDFREAGYLYSIQPGSYHVLYTLTRVSGLPSLSVYCAVSALAAGAFIVLASLLLARATGLRFAWVLVALLLTPELISGACYANTNTLAGAMAMGGLIIAQSARGRGAYWRAGLFLGLGAWLRMDSLLLAPVVLPLRLACGSPRRALLETAEIALVTLLTLLVVCAAVHTPLTAAWREFSQRKNFNVMQMLWVNGWLALGVVATVAGLFGLGHLIRHQRWWLLGVVAAGSAPCLLVYGGNFTTPKYLYYAAPFLILPGLAWLQALLSDDTGRPRQNSRLAFSVVALFAIEAVFGVQTSSAAFRRFDPAPPFLVLHSSVIRNKRIQLGLGEGEIIPTDDGPRLRGGQFWAPQMWRREKTAMHEEMIRLDALLTDQPPELLLTSTYLAYQVAGGWLRDHAFQLGSPRTIEDNPTSFVVDCHGSKHSLQLVQVNHTEADAREFASSIQPGQQALFLNDLGGIGFRHLAAELRGWRLLSPSENQLLTTYAYPSP